MDAARIDPNVIDLSPQSEPLPEVPTDAKTQIVVVGGGAGGLELAAKLSAKYNPRDYDIILLEKNRTHVWKPLLHEVAAGSLDANLDEVGYRAHAHRWGYRFFLGSLMDIDRDRREVIVAPLLDEDGQELIGEHRIRYDYLVIAVGSVSNDFGVTGVKQNCMALESRRDADAFRSRLLNHCLKTSRRLSVDPSSDDMVRVGIVGAGATGVELAAELYNAASSLGYYGLEVFDESRLKVTLIEASSRILPALPEKLSEAAHAELEALGVEVITNAVVTEVTNTDIHTKDGAVIPADLRVWAAGVKGPEFLRGIAGLETNARDQLVVRDTLQTSFDDRIFAIGDCVEFIPNGETKPLPPRAQTAHQMAATVFKNISASIDERTLKPFVYHDHGSLVSLSRFATVGSLMGNLIGGRMAVEGRLARFFYVSLYRLHLIAIHGWLRGIGLIITGHVNRITRPKLKLH
ncbi:MAG: NAD(P)/FAD-dependent oxidoreductase [Pseudomonadota bacterium]